MAEVSIDFLLDEDIANHLEKLAKDSNQSTTQIVQELIEERYKKFKVQQRKKVLKEMSGFGNELLGDFSIQSVKANMDI